MDGTETVARTRTLAGRRPFVNDSSRTHQRPMWLEMGLRLGAARNIVSLGIAGAATLIAGAAPAGAAQTCDRIVSSVSSAQTAVSQVGGGKVVCMADGSYGGLTLSASRTSTVTLRSERPGRATIDGASLSGRNLSLSRFKVTDDIAIQPGSEAISVEYNRITGGYMGIDAGPTTSTNDLATRRSAATSSSARSARTRCASTATTTALTPTGTGS